MLYINILYSVFPESHVVFSLAFPNIHLCFDFCAIFKSHPNIIFLIYSNEIYQTAPQSFIKNANKFLFL